MAIRLNYAGGASQEQRFIRDKQKSLQKALLYSYQAATIVINRKGLPLQFRCLINSDKVKGDYDDKVISIPYKDYCLNSQCQQKFPIDLKCGQVFLWKQTNTYWMPYIQHVEEDAYFRAEIRRCDQIAEIDGHEYRVFVRGPSQTAIVWAQKAGVQWNDLNHSLVMFITSDIWTQRYLHRFAKIKVRQDNGINKTWEVAATNPYFGQGIIQVMLNETFENSIEDAAKKQKQAIYKDTNYPQQPSQKYIDGPVEVQCYSTAVYKVSGMGVGRWYWQQDGRRRDLEVESDVLNLEITSGKSCKFKLVYKEKQSDEQIFIEVYVKSI